MSLRDHLFKVAGNSDAQLLLALVIGLGQAQANAPKHDAVVGLGAWELWDLLERHPRPGEIHPSIDHRWSSQHEMTRALSRLKRQGFVRNGPGDMYAIGPSVWRPTEAAFGYLRKRVIFEPSRSDRARRHSRGKAA
jgi:hypothetical protein